MDYAKSYMNATTLADRIRQSATQGTTTKAGLASRETTRQEYEDNLEVVRAKYLNSIRNMFADVLPPIEEAEKDIKDYLGETDKPRPQRNPNYWADSPFMSETSLPETEDNVAAILATIKVRESGGDYNVKNPEGSASGAYQMIDSTWQSLSQKYGIGTEYSSAKDAPPEVQDAVAGNYVREILLQNNNDVTKVPLVWYTGNAQGKISKKAIELNNGLTPQEYQNNWMRAFNKMVGN